MGWCSPAEAKRGSLVQFSQEAELIFPIVPAQYTLPQHLFRCFGVLNLYQPKLNFNFKISFKSLFKKTYLTYEGKVITG
jgi:hypothetical protein